MRQLLPDKPTNIERGIVNLGDLSSGGTHWTCYVKRGEKKLYFDSYGDVNPPIEVVRYLGPKGLVYNSERIQGFDDPPICGHLCLEVLRRDSAGEDWEHILRNIRNNKNAWKPWFYFQQIWRRN
ncbi:hypothetical protein J6590_108358 [Homalodisca vitripennis]|nr:hypothetical protein J6590_108358 [Homalodisca vitripennis]